jgi:hypothetical protein
VYSNILVRNREQNPKNENSIRKSLDIQDILKTKYNISKMNTITIADCRYSKNKTLYLLVLGTSVRLIKYIRISQKGISPA